MLTANEHHFVLIRQYREGFEARHIILVRCIEAEAAEDDVGLLEAAFLLPFFGRLALQKVAPFVLRQKSRGNRGDIASRNAVHAFKTPTVAAWIGHTMTS